MGMEWMSFKDNKLVPTAIILAGALGLMVRIALCGFLIYVFRHFGEGMKEKGESKSVRG